MSTSTPPRSSDANPTHPSSTSHPEAHLETRPDSSAHSSAHSSVLWALFGNSFVMIAKLGAFLLTGSGSMLAESIHSLADVLNQSLLYLGIKRAERAPNAERARGHGREQFAWALISAVGIFFLGCGVTLYHGVQHLLHPPTHATSSSDFIVSVVVLALSLLIEGWVFWVALRAARAQAGERALIDYLKSDADPTLLAVLLEDGAACLGILFAALGIALTHLTGIHLWDTIGTLIIGILLGVIAIWLIGINLKLLVGRGLSPERVARIRKTVGDVSYVEGLEQLHSESIGANRFELHLDLELDELKLVQRVQLDLSEAYQQIKTEEEFIAFCHQYGAESMRVVYRAIDELEDQIKEDIHEVDYIDIEPN